MAAMIAVQAGWDINDYSLETTPEEPHARTLRPHRQNHTAVTMVLDAERDVAAPSNL
jgi:hypothetical protein